MRQAFSINCLLISDNDFMVVDFRVLKYDFATTTHNGKTRIFDNVFVVPFQRPSNPELLSWSHILALISVTNSHMYLRFSHSPFPTYFIIRIVRRNDDCNFSLRFASFHSKFVSFSFRQIFAMRFECVFWDERNTPSFNQLLRCDTFIYCILFADNISVVAFVMQWRYLSSLLSLFIANNL